MEENFFCDNRFARKTFIYKKLAQTSSKSLSISSLMSEHLGTVARADLWA